MVPIILHIGCGPDVRGGWINIDQNVDTSIRSDGTINISHDLRKGIPLEDNYADMTYTSHFFEHLDTMDGLKVMQECFRVLKPGGIFRNAIPDGRMSIKAYMENNLAWFDGRDSIIPEDGLPPKPIRSPIDYIHRDGTAWDHKSLYDFDKLKNMLTIVGFVDIREVGYNADIDSPHPARIAASFYSVATKP